MSSELEIVIPSRDRDLGGFFVHRVLPYERHRMIGPFIFFDHMGPAQFEAGKGIEVRPHPHINLATVTYLFNGRIQHKDSLGSDQVIEPGAINWMIAGRGIVHSERALKEDLLKPMELHGIQLWVALPEEMEESSPSFSHHPRKSLPEFTHQNMPMKLLLGKAFGYESPVAVFSDLFYVEVNIKKGQSLHVPQDGREWGFYVVNGKVSSGGQNVEAFSMAAIKENNDLQLVALEDSKLMLLGGTSLGPRHIFWNFVSSSKERIDQVKKEWAEHGPRKESSRFQPIPGDDQEFIPLKI